jgi:ASC-1-like (ASCH) protein
LVSFNLVDYRYNLFERVALKCTFNHTTFGLPWKEHSLPIQQHWADAIAAGTKVIEGRLARGAVMRVHVGDTVVFNHIYTKVVHIEHYDTFSDMLDAVGLENALPGTGSIEDGVEIYKQFRGYGEAEANCGVRALHVELLE